MADDGATEGFWRFSLMIYARPGIAEALLRLQDRGGHNINIILFGLWLALCEGAALDAAGLARAKTAIARIDSAVVAPLRALRRALKPDADPDAQDLRRRVLALEIAAERCVQARLARSAEPRKARGGDRRSLAEASLRLILGADFGSEEAVVVVKALSSRPSA
ncbi:MAG TPA: TIGR02444 family protein [Stellaceae bacterium]|nr:TIGR02444 family protein [Stellaceae bacterium]